MQVMLDFSSNRKLEATDGGDIYNPMNTIYSQLFSLNVQDVVKAVAVAVFAAVLGALQQAVTAHGFDVGAYDWGAILTIAGQAGAAYLAKNFLSADNGKVFGHIG